MVGVSVTGIGVEQQRQALAVLRPDQRVVPGSTKEGAMKNSERCKTKVETPPMVSKTRRTQGRLDGARLHGHPLRVNAADIPRASAPMRFEESGEEAIKDVVIQQAHRNLADEDSRLATLTERALEIGPEFLVDADRRPRAVTGYRRSGCTRPVLRAGSHRSRNVRVRR
jgi:hypothetical protein